MFKKSIAMAWVCATLSLSVGIPQARAHYQNTAAPTLEQKIMYSIFGALLGATAIISAEQIATFAELKKSNTMHGQPKAARKIRLMHIKEREESAEVGAILLPNIALAFGLLVWPERPTFAFNHGMWFRK